MPKVAYAPSVDLYVKRVGLEFVLHNKKAYGGVEAKFHAFLTSAPNGSGQLHAPAGFNSGKNGRRLSGPQSRSGRFG